MLGRQGRLIETGLREGTAGNGERMGQVDSNECVWIERVEAPEPVGELLTLVVFEEDLVHLCQIDGALLPGWRLCLRVLDLPIYLKVVFHITRRRGSGLDSGIVPIDRRGYVLSDFFSRDVDILAERVSPVFEHSRISILGEVSFCGNTIPAEIFRVALNIVE